MMKPEQIDRLIQQADGLAPKEGSIFRALAKLTEAEVRKQDEALILQLVDALEHIHRCIPTGGFAQIHWDSASFEQIVQAAEAGRARLESKP